LYVKATFIRCFHRYQLGVTPRFQYTHLTKEIARKSCVAAGRATAIAARATIIAPRDRIAPRATTIAPRSLARRAPRGPRARVW
jgi:hypothetical protein